KDGTSFPKPRSPQSRHVPPPPYPPGLPFRVQNPARSCLSYVLFAFFGSAAGIPRCPPPCANKTADITRPPHRTMAACSQFVFIAAPPRLLEEHLQGHRLRRP